MIHRRRLLAAALLTIGSILVACSGRAGGMEGIDRGKTARDFTLASLDGSNISLSDYRGHVVLVNLWATWCPPCRDEIPDLEQAYRAHQDDGLVVLGVNVEDPAQLVESFVRDAGMSYPILLDRTGKVYREYRAPGLPMTLVVDREGIIQVRHAGYLSREKLAEYLDQVLLAP